MSGKRKHEADLLEQAKALPSARDAWQERLEAFTEHNTPLLLIYQLPGERTSDIHMKAVAWDALTEGERQIALDNGAEMEELADLVGNAAYDDVDECGSALEAYIRLQPHVVLLDFEELAGLNIRRAVIVGE